MYGHVITKFSRMGRLLHFVTHGALLARLARESSAIMNLNGTPFHSVSYSSLKLRVIRRSAFGILQNTPAGIVRL